MRQRLRFAVLAAATITIPLSAGAAPVRLAQTIQGAGAAAAPVSGSPATAQAPAPQSPPSTPTPLTGAPAWNTLLGNTINGSTPDGAYIEYFSQDGTVVHVDRDGKDSGQWRLREPSVCFTYPDEDAEDCRELEVDGNRGVFIDPDGSRYHFEIVPGNPQHL